LMNRAFAKGTLAMRAGISERIEAMI
jgi:hypothetical protein